ncbi:thiamine pyrophosphate-dependent enzyme [Ilyobacter sp.]|jgi:2-oxoglutarate ferredoxin oxidoreductase subunit beta|uniref:thiamine pyrophosphate-dependent enzyme n=1 Tax=Ilyobacter sp. TaxID=3100343 RepID=UPI003569E002
MEVVFQKTKGLTDAVTHYCPGCTHGIIHRLVGEVLEELGVLEKSIGVASVGCSALSYKYFNCDMQAGPHGRAPALATGIKRVNLDCTVFTYQGDGDLASIGCAEIIHAALRGENFTTIFVNNAVYGMTGGQMAPTTLINQKSTTSPYGRDKKIHGMPIKMSEILATLDRAVYVVRVSVHDPKHVREAKAAIKKAFELQIKGEGFTIVEVLSTCPTNWGMTPIEALDWLKDNMIPYYPLGVIKSPEKEDD